jgi:hypothetical protein
MVLVLLHFKERQSHQQAEEISGLPARALSYVLLLARILAAHRASVQAHESAKEELCLNFNLLKSG